MENELYIWPVKSVYCLTGVGGNILLPYNISRLLKYNFANDWTKYGDQVLCYLNEYLLQYP